MHSVGALILAATPMFLLARADVDFDGDDVPANCRAICRPIAELSRRCDASDLYGDDDPREDEYERNEDRLRAQCVCTNTSFDVANIAGLCADCIRQNPTSPGNRDDDDDDDDDVNDVEDHRDELDDINQLIATCGFSATASYAPSASTAADRITVVASAPTAASQLTTTFSGATGGPIPASSTGQFGATATGGNSGGNDDNNNGNNDNNDDNNSNGNNDDNSNSNDSNNNGDGGSFAIRGAVPLGGLSGSAVLYGFGALAAGAAVFML